jgi:putative spermidine/putrescine transport system permease protein
MRRRGLNPLNIGLNSALVVVTIFILAPIVFVIINSFNAASFNVFPPQGFSLRWYSVVLNEPAFIKAFANSLLVGFGTMALSLVVGTMAAWTFVRYRYTGQSFVNSFFFAPIAVPRIGLGIAVFLLYIRVGLYGGRFGLVLIHSLLGLPFVISIMTAVLFSADPMLEDAAQDLGATKLQAFLRVTLPQLSTGLVVAGLFAFITSFDELVTSIFLVRPENNTLPIEMFLYVQEYQNPTLAALASLLIGITIFVVILLYPILKGREARRLLARQ